MQDGFRYINRRRFIQLAVSAAASPRLLQKASDPISVLRSPGYRVEPYRMSGDEYNRRYRVPVGISGFQCPRGHQRILAGEPGVRKLRCVVCVREPDLTGRNGLYWPQRGGGSADGFVCVSSCVGNPSDPRDLGAGVSIRFGHVLVAPAAHWLDCQRLGFA